MNENNSIISFFAISEWDGMIKELLDQRADVAIADLTITYNREQVVVLPFYINQILSSSINSL